MGEKDHTQAAEEVRLTHSHEVSPDEEGKRLDVVLHSLMRGLSRSAVQSAIKEGSVTLNDAPATCSRRVKAGDVIRWRLPSRTDTLKPQVMEISVVYEDEHIIVINKPAGIAVHPPTPSGDGTLANALAAHTPTLADTYDPARPGIVHRLDKNTSGVMVAAKTQQAWKALGEQFRERAVKKTYIAITDGTPPLDADEVTIGIRRNRRHPQLMEATDAPDARRAVTRYKVIRRVRNLAAVEAHPITGRTHQIRVTFRYLGCPLCCDTAYGGRPTLTRGAITGEKDPTVVMNRCALHSLRIEFRHPATGKRLQFTAPLSEDMEEALELMKAKTEVET